MLYRFPICNKNIFKYKWNELHLKINKIERNKKNICYETTLIFIHNDNLILWNIRQKLYQGYSHFFADFGPLSIDQFYNYVQLVREQLECLSNDKKVTYHCTGIAPHLYTNAAVFCIAYTVLILEKTIEGAYTPFLSLPPLVPFRDVSFGISEYNVLPIDAVYALIKGTKAKILDIYTFDYKEYMRTLSVDNGDITWLVPNKICVTSSPNEYPTMMWNGKYTWGINQYLQYFKEKGVTDVIRLEENTYDTKIWERNGIRFYDLVFTDGDCPLQRVLVRFFDIVDKPGSIIAIHCKSGCGKSSILIAAYLIKHYRFTTDEAMMWLRMFRPGSVFGIQQKWLRVNQEDLWNQKHFDEKLVEMSTDSQKKMIQQFKAERNKLKTPIFLDSLPAASPIKVPKKSSTTSSGMVTSASVPSIMSREYKLELFSRTRGCFSPDSSKYRTKLDGTIQTVSVPQYWSLNNSMNRSMYAKTVMPK